jgi:hypothetical protein
MALTMSDSPLVGFKVNEFRFVSIPRLIGEFGQI